MKINVNYFITTFCFGGPYVKEEKVPGDNEDGEYFKDCKYRRRINDNPD